MADDTASLVAPAQSPAAGECGGKLRVGVLLRSLDIPAWQHVALSRVASSSYAELALVMLAPDADHSARRSAERRGPVTAALQRILARLDENMVCEVDALACVDATALLRDLPRAPWPAPADFAPGAASAPFDVDVLVDFVGGDVPGSAAARARYGVWRLRQPCSAALAAEEASFWPVYHDWGVGAAILESYRADGSTVTLARAAPAINRYSLKLSTSALCWRMTSLLANKLRELHAVGVEALPSSEPEGCLQDTRPQREAGAFELAAYVGRNVARRARASASRRFMLDQWILMYHCGPELSTTPSEFTKLVPPIDRFWADPHLVRRDGRYYAFVEELPFATGKGHIAVLAMEEDGSWGEAERVLERDYHLSYPFVFEHDGNLYMVPESEQNRTIDLYRCAQFPARWEFVTTLLGDIAATDSTLLHRDGRWWLFTNVVDTPGASSSEELYLFYSDALLGGEWKAHSRNPVISDARRSRPAGAILEHDGRLLRPGQDCSVRYGYGIRLHEIEQLSEAEYREREVARITPTWDRAIVAAHTLSYVPGLTMIDALQPRLRF